MIIGKFLTRILGSGIRTFMQGKAKLNTATQDNPASLTYNLHEQSIPIDETLIALHGDPSKVLEALTPKFKTTYEKGLNISKYIQYAAYLYDLDPDLESKSRHLNRVLENRYKEAFITFAQSTPSAEQLAICDQWHDAFIECVECDQNPAEYLTNYTNLIQEDPSNESLRIYRKGLDACIKHRPNTTIDYTYSFSGVISRKPTDTQLALYEEGLDACIQHISKTKVGYTDDYPEEDPSRNLEECEFGNIPANIIVNYTDAFFRLVSYKPANTQLEIYRQGLDAYKQYEYGPHNYTDVFGSLILQGLSDTELIAKLAIYKKGLDTYRKDGYNADDYTRAFQKLVKNNYTDRQLIAILALYKKGLDICKKQNYRTGYYIRSFVYGLAQHTLSDAQLALYEKGLDACKNYSKSVIYYANYFSSLVHKRAKDTLLSLYVKSFDPFTESDSSFCRHSEAFEALTGDNEPTDAQLAVYERDLDTAKQHGFSPHDYTAIFIELLKNKPTDAELTAQLALYIKGFDTAKQHGFSPHDYRAIFIELLKNKPTDAELTAQLALYIEGFDTTKQHGLSSLDYTVTFIKLLKNKPTDAELTAQLAALYDEKRFPIILAYINNSWINHKLLEILPLLTHNEYKTESENYLSALNKGLYPSQNAADTALANILVRSELIKRSKNSGRDFNLGPILILDHFPWSSRYQPQFRKAAFKQTAEIMLAGALRSRSSLSEAYACRRIGESELSQYEDLLLWLKPKQDPKPYEAAWNNKGFPGNGWCFANIKLSERIKQYISKLTAWSPNVVETEPISQSEAEARSKEILEEFTQSQIYKLRGALIISPPESSENYKLLSTQGIKEPFSYIVYNNHHDNSVNATALLVPTRIIKNCKDLNELKAETLIKNPEALDLSSMSVFGGGLTNARQPNSKPLHEWEFERRGRETQDLAGHIHKSHIFGGYVTDWDRLGPRLEEFRQDHLAIYEIANRYQSMCYQLDLLEALHTKGFTNQDEEDLETEISEEDLTGSIDYLKSLMNRWKDYYKTRDEANNQAVLVDVDVFDKASRIEDWNIMFDPKKNKFYQRTTDGNYKELGSELGEFNLLQQLQADNRTARFVPKNFVKIEGEKI